MYIYIYLCVCMFVAIKSRNFFVKTHNCGLIQCDVRSAASWTVLRATLSGDECRAVCDLLGVHPCVNFNPTMEPCRGKLSSEPRYTAMLVC